MKTYRRIVLLSTLVVSLLFLPCFVLAGPPVPDCCTPEYAKEAMDSYRSLIFKTSVYESLPQTGMGLRLGVYQAQADYGPGASAKNMDRLEKAARIARKLGVQLLSFPELYVPGYTLSPEDAKKVAETSDGPSITRARKIAAELEMAMLVPYAEKVTTGDQTLYYDSIAVINERGELVTSYKKTHLYGQQERDNWSFGNKAPPVFKVFGFPVGVLNCYENEFPELVRLLALQGAKLIVGPTAADCYYALPGGKRSDVPYPDISTLLVADCLPGYYGMTHPAPKYNYLRDRRPEMYAPLTAPKADFVEGGWHYPTFRDGREIGRD